MTADTEKNVNKENKCNKANDNTDNLVKWFWYSNIPNEPPYAIKY
jgi:type II restriction/modification system DNA methylase subunit YeeA